MISVQNIYIEPEKAKSGEPKVRVEANGENKVLIKRNIQPATVLEMKFARLRKVIRRRSSAIL